MCVCVGGVCVRGCVCVCGDLPQEMNVDRETRLHTKGALGTTQTLDALCTGE